MASVTTFPRSTAGARAADGGILVVDDIVKQFETPEGPVLAVDHVSLSVKPVRMRQVDVVQCDRRPA
jgi:hypothetical protein